MEAPATTAARTPRKRDLDNPIAYTLEDARNTAGVSTTKLYDLIAAGTLDARKAGRRTVIMADSLNAYLRGLPPATINRKLRQKAAA